ncbi:MAG: alpha/beta fold hydrolase [Flavobacteriales bacterium]|nr:alpha/beta fold hydrolase [Flavobacteriales bacterium]
MKLHFRKAGSGNPLIIVHGLFGSGDNWQSLAKKFSENFTVYAIDLRNHGRSPHGTPMNFDVMADDLLELCKEEKLHGVSMIGHSLGGKAILRFAQLNGLVAEKLLVADIGVKKYEPHHTHIFEALLAVNFESINSRKEVEEILSAHIAEISVRQFLLKNLYWKESGKLAWRFNLEVLHQSSNEMNAALPSKQIVAEALFVRGVNSLYINDEDWPAIRDMISQASLQTIEGAGHWVHADAPEEFFRIAVEFFRSGN